MRKVKAFFLVIFAFCTIAAHGVSGQERNSITGFVFNDSRQPVAEVYVELQNDLYSTVGRTQTRGSGMYSFVGLPNGQYNVKVLTGRTEYQEQIKPVSLVSLSAGSGGIGRGSATEQVDFYLKVQKQRVGETGSPGVVFVQEVPPEARSLYEAGILDLANKNDTAGMDKIKRSLEAFSDFYIALDRLGAEYLARGYYEPAYVLFKKAIDVNPRSFSSTAGLGLAEYRLGRADRAVGRFKEAVTMDKGSANAHLWLGIAHHANKNLPDALSALLLADKLNSGKDAEVHWQLARVYKDQKKFARAADELDLFLTLKPDAANAAEIRKIILTLRSKV